MSPSDDMACRQALDIRGLRRENRIMARLLRKAVGLVAAYAIALQAVLSGVLAIEHHNPDPFSIICTSDNSSDNSSDSGSQPHF